MHVTDIKLKSASVLPLRSEAYEAYYSWLICPGGWHRDSALVERCNHAVALEMLEEADPSGEDYTVLRFGHWGVGWVEEILVRPGTAAHRCAQEIDAALASYPILSDDRHSEMEMEAHDAGECEDGCSCCDYERTQPMRIKLDNLGSDDGSVLVTADARRARDDQTIDGSRWECAGDFAYACITDRPGLVAELERDGYEVDASEYCEPDAAEED